jgi:BirA family biotin operon repressor/biotin-[acetyl-CoA-carboxylase] ligase
MKFLPVTWFDQLDSTNRQLKRLLAENSDLPVGTVIAARDQTDGRGRGERFWQSIPGKDLTFSFFWQTQQQEDYFHTLTLAVGLSVAKTISETCNLPARLKWPNDVLVRQKKICGILCECVKSASGRTSVIVGIGLNVNMSQGDAENIDQPATSLKIETGRPHDIKNILSLVLREMTQTLQQWENEGFDSLRAQWLDRCDALGQQVIIAQPDEKKVSGTFSGIGPCGEVQLLDARGETLTFLTGDMAPAK